MKKLLFILIFVVGCVYSYSTDITYYIGKGTEIILNENKKIDEYTANKISYYVYNESQKYNIDFHFALGIITTESHFNIKAKSKCGAIGLMQVMPSTARYVAKLYDIKYTNLYDIETNIKLGMAYLANLKTQFENDKVVAAGYNGGKGGAIKYQKYLTGECSMYSIPRETRKYVPTVMNYTTKYKTYIYENGKDFE